jgi:hypothetical protein
MENEHCICTYLSRRIWWTIVNCLNTVCRNGGLNASWRLADCFLSDYVSDPGNKTKITGCFIAVLIFNLLEDAKWRYIRRYHHPALLLKSVCEGPWRIMHRAQTVKYRDYMKLVCACFWWRVGFWNWPPSARKASFPSFRDYQQIPAYGVRRQKIHKTWGRSVLDWPDSENPGGTCSMSVLCHD